MSALAQFPAPWAGGPSPSLQPSVAALFMARPTMQPGSSLSLTLGNLAYRRRRSVRVPLGAETGNPIYRQSHLLRGSDFPDVGRSSPTRLATKGCLPGEHHGAGLEQPKH